MHSVTRESIRKQNKTKKKGLRYNIFKSVFACVTWKNNSFCLFKQAKSGLQIVEYLSQNIGYTC